MISKVMVAVASESNEKRKRKLSYGNCTRTINLQEKG